MNVPPSVLTHGWVRVYNFFTAYLNKYQSMYMEIMAVRKRHYRRRLFGMRLMVMAVVERKWDRGSAGFCNEGRDDREKIHQRAGGQQRFSKRCQHTWRTRSYISASHIYSLFYFVRELESVFSHCLLFLRRSTLRHLLLIACVESCECYGYYRSFITERIHSSHNYIREYRKLSMISMYFQENWSLSPKVLMGITETIHSIETHRWFHYSQTTDGENLEFFSYYLPPVPEDTGSSRRGYW